MSSADMDIISYHAGNMKVTRRSTMSSKGARPMCTHWFLIEVAGTRSCFVLYRVGPSSEGEVRIVPVHPFKKLNSPKEFISEDEIKELFRSGASLTVGGTFSRVQIGDYVVARDVYESTGQEILDSMEYLYNYPVKSCQSPQDDGTFSRHFVSKINTFRHNTCMNNQDMVSRIDKSASNLRIDFALIGGAMLVFAILVSAIFSYKAYLSASIGVCPV